MLRSFYLWFTTLVMALVTFAVQATTYSLANSEIIPFTSKVNQQQYQLYVALPANYNPEQHYPLVVTLDADYAFALTRNIHQHFSQRGNLNDAIIVGVAYPGAEQSSDVYRRNRVRDYTPIAHPSDGYGEQISQVSGGAAQFAKLLGSEVLPLLEQRFSLSQQRMLIGHSFGGLFASYVLSHQPELFNQYLIVSPSYWYAEQWLMNHFPEKSSLSVSQGYQPKVFIAVGSLENQPQRGRAMVDDVHKFAALLASRYQWPATVQVFADENHNSVFPAAVSRGLRVLNR